MMDDDQDTYVSQLKEVFDSCDDSGTGYLNKDELCDLCDKLQLHDQTGFFVKRLLDGSTDGKIDFGEFKDCFVALLTQSVNNSAADDELKNQQESGGSEREVSPKFVLGQKKYGRRSRPESSTADTDNDVHSDFSAEDDILSVTADPHRGGHTIELLDNVFQNTNNDRRTTPSRLHLLNKRGSLQRSGSNKSITSSFEQKSSDGLDSERADSDISSTYHGDNEEQYLRGIWRKLGVGKGGYLDLKELTVVCQHIGMEKMSDEVVLQLFEKLDSDQDGKVSFDDFLQGLFQHGFSPGTPECSVISDGSPVSSVPIKIKQSLTGYTVDVGDDRKSSVSGLLVSDSGVFSAIDPDNTGFADASVINELWESLCLNGGIQLLRELGFNTNQKINLQDLTDILEEELQSNQHTGLYQHAVASYINEMQVVKTNLEQVRTEKDKVKADLSEANSRAAILAQDVDDHHAKLEQSSQKKIMYLDKKYQEQIKNLQVELEREREQVSNHEARLRQQLCGEIETIKEDDAKIKEELSYLTKENKRLEMESTNLNEKLLESDRLNNIHLKELESLSELRQKIADIECGRQYYSDQQYQTLIDDLKTYRKENQELKDCNDELSAEVESLQKELNLSERPSKRHKRNGSWLIDYNKSSPNSSLKRRESGSSTEDAPCNSDEENPMSGKMRRRLMLSPIDQERISIEVETLEEKYKEEIDKLTSEFERAVSDLQDSYETRIIKMEAQLGKEINSNNVIKENEFKERINELTKDRETVRQQAKQEADRKLESYVTTEKQLKLDLESQKQLIIEIEKNHLSDKNELITRMEREYDEKLENSQCEWYQRLEDLRQESGDELESSSCKRLSSRKKDGKLSGLDLLKHLEEQKLLMQRKYKNLKSQLKVTTEELEMSLAREAQVEESHASLQKRCLKVEERLIQMASGMDTSSETSTELVTSISDELSVKNRPVEIVVTENSQLRRRNALLVTRCGVLERSLHAAKAREYFASAYDGVKVDDNKTDEELQRLESERKIEQLECQLQLSQQEVQSCKLETEKFWKNRVEDEKRSLETLSNELSNKCASLEEKVVNLEEDNENLKKLCNESTKAEHIFVNGVQGLGGRLLEDFERLVSLRVHKLWQNIVQNGETALTGQLKQDFNNMLIHAVRQVEESIRKHYDQEHEKIKRRCEVENIKMRETLNREKMILESSYEEKINDLEKSQVQDDEPNRTDILLKDLFVENASLVKALQLTEERQIKAEQTNMRLQKKCRMLSKILADVSRVAVN